jgi:hypothetical protein
MVSMIVLLENCEYPATVLDILGHEYTIQLPNGNVIVPYVGYLRNRETHNTVIILPKVFLVNEQLLGLPLHTYLADSSSRELKVSGLTHRDCETLFRFSFLLHCSLVEYRRRRPDSTVAELDQVEAVTTNLGRDEQTELELVVSLLEFYRKHRDLFAFLSSYSRKKSNKRISWKKTIRQIVPVLYEEEAYYPEYVTRSRTIDCNEELMVIFLSTLNYLKEEYGIQVDIDPAYPIMRGNEFRRFSRTATRKLRLLRHKYFSDAFVVMYRLLLKYFSRCQSSSLGRPKVEYVLARHYHVVFEDMVDAVLAYGDMTRDEAEQMKNQPDGKIVDHMFMHESLIQRKIHYIGDSKYYKETTAFSKHAIYKQHTYAKNVIQYNINLLRNKEMDPRVRYLDELTEGYNIVPNFFIQAFVPNSLDDIQPHFRHKEGQEWESIHYPNRLFDRDTLIVHSFEVNFLFVLQSYVSKNRGERRGFQGEIYPYIRACLLSYYNRRFLFFRLEPIESVAVFIERFFRLLVGKIYSVQDVDGGTELILALDRKEEEGNEQLLEILVPHLDMKQRFELV